MIPRALLAVGLACLMVLTGTFTYIYLEGRQSKVAVAPKKPTLAIPSPHAFTLPGTLFLAQAGALYSLNSGRFHQLTAEEGWSQPSLFPNGLLAVKRSVLYSDIYILNRFGQVQRQETVDIASIPTGADPSSYNWAFYPRISPDQTSLWLAYDNPKYGYDVILSIWQMPLYGSIHEGKLWSSADDYTGGDVQPIPLAGGGVIYTKYSYGPDLKLIGQLWYTNRPSGSFVTGHALTDPSEDCRDPALSPDGHEVAMICTYEKQISYLTIATWDGSNLGPRTTLVSSQLVAQPTWAPDGSGIAYLAPGSPDGPFQLWFLPKNAYAPPPPSPIPTPTPTPGGPYNGHLPSPSPLPAPTPIVVRPIQITTDQGFDATSPMAWTG